MEHLHIRAVYNLIYNATLLVRAGMGCAITIDKLINTSGDSDLCFRPLSPTLETHLDMAWKKHAVFSRPAQIFLEYLQEDAKNGNTSPVTNRKGHGGAQAPHRSTPGKTGKFCKSFTKVLRDAHAHEPS